MDNVTAKFDLTLYVAENRQAGSLNSSDGLAGAIEYNTDLFDRATICRMTGHLQTLLAEIVDDPKQPIHALPMLTAAERQQLFVTWNATESPYPEAICIHQLIEEQVERTPEAVAVVCDNRQLTYRDLNTWANRLAYELRDLGIGPGKLVGLCLEPSLEMVVGLLGTLKAGGAYVPLDPTYPRDRLHLMLTGAEIEVLVSQDHLVSRLPDGGHRIFPDAEPPLTDTARSANPASGVTSDDLIYMIYTSGSTGVPKGAGVYHRGFTNLVRWFVNDFQLGPQDRVLITSSLSFDLTQKNFFAPLAVGGSLHLSAAAPYDYPQLRQQVGHHKITWLNCAPSAFYPFLEPEEEQTFRQLASLRCLFLGGEPIAMERLWPWMQSPHCQATLVNTYGPTECTDISAAYRVEQPETFLQQVIPIGQPIFNAQIYVLDRHGEAVPIGVPGELCIGGAGVGAGYLNDPALTAAKFVSHPLCRDSEAKLYRTGDLVRYRSDGNLEFMGRLDQQVKIRGFRIELGEIETQLRQHSAVQEAVAVARETESGVQQLTAYVVPVPEAMLPAPFLVPDLRDHLKQTLPDYMIPAAFVRLDRLPLTPSGKVNREMLPAPATSDVVVGHTQLLTPTEEVLAAIWAEVLSLERVSRHDDFFDLGGHSLLAIRIISRLQEALQVTLSVRTVFEAPAIHQLAAAIETARYSEFSLPMPPPLRPIGRDEPLPLSYAQQRLWFLDRLEGPSPTYNVPMAFRLTGSLDVTALEQAFNAMVRRHESLRTIFPMVEKQPIQQILDSLSVPLPSIGLQHLSGRERAAELHHLLAQEVARPFDLSQGPLLRITLFELEDHECVLLVNIHHIIADDWSMGIWWRELDALYRACMQQQDTASLDTLPRLSVQYADFAQWQREWLTGEVLARQLAYWQGQLKAAPTLLSLPTDRPRPPEQTFNGRIERFELDAQLVEAVRDLGRQASASPFMVFSTAFAILLSRYSCQEDLVIGTPVANRQTREIEPVIGLLTNTLALRLDLSGNPGFDLLLRHVRQVTLDAFLHQDIPFEQLVSELHIERHLSHAPLFQVMFVWQNLLPEPVALGDLHLSPVDVDLVTARFDLLLYLTEIESDDDLTQGRRLIGAMEYNTDLFDRTTIRRMIGHLQALLAGITANPAQPVHQLPLLTSAERQQLLVEWNETRTSYPADRCVHQLAEAQAERTPHAIAAIWGEQWLTYDALNQRANQLAHYLRALGVGPDVVVGLYIERGLDMNIALLGVLKAGGAYLPLDTTYPSERLSFMLTDAEVPVLLTQAPLVSRLPKTTARIVCLDTDAAHIATYGSDHVPVLCTPLNLAYVMYTSGSTGRPKGVAMPHQPLCNLLWWQQQQRPFAYPARTLQFTPLSFDVSFQEIFSTWCTGGTLVLISDEERRNPQNLLDIMTDQTIQRLFLPFVALQHIAEFAVHCETYPTGLRDVITAGEQLRITPAIAEWFRQTGAGLHNHYGPTESHVITAHSLDQDMDQWPTLPPIGRPVANCRTYILDANAQPAPIGAAGGLYLSGAGLARGYLHRPALTATRFIPNPWGEDRFYQTGDMARYRADGSIEFLGRIDDQVKIRGYRIELGEIEAVLSQHTAVKEAVVVAQEDQTGDKRLVAYIVPTSEPASSQPLALAPDFSTYLKLTLPDYMVPLTFIQLDHLPQTPSGKVDRRALPAPNRVQPTLTEDYVAPQNDLEKALTAIWQDVLSLDQVGIHDNFFEVGGHSLSIVHIHAKLADLTARDVSLTDLFRYPTIASLARYLGQSLPESASAQPYVKRAQSRREAHNKRVARAPRRHLRSR